MFVVAMLILSLTALAISAIVKDSAEYGVIDDILEAWLSDKISRAAGVARLVSALMSIVWAAVWLIACIIGLFVK